MHRGVRIGELYNLSSDLRISNKMLNFIQYKIVYCNQVYMTTNTVTLETLNTTLDKILCILQHQSAKSIIYQYFMPYASKLKRILDVLKLDYMKGSGNYAIWKSVTEIQESKESIITNSKSNCESIISLSRQIMQDTDTISGQWKDWLTKNVCEILDDSTNFMKGLENESSLISNCYKYLTFVTDRIDHMKILMESDWTYVP